MDAAAVQRFADADPSGLLPPRPGFAAHLDGAPRALDALDLGEGRGLAVLAAGEELVVAPVVQESGAVRRAIAGDGAYAAMLDMIGDGSPLGAFAPATWSDPPLRGPGVEDAIVADHSNDVVVVDRRAVVKLYPRTAPGPQPGLDLPAHLAAVGFGLTPAPIGALTWHGSGGGSLVATAAVYLPGARDGWDWFVDALLGALDGEHRWPTADAVSLGRLTGSFHRAMATPSPVFPSPVSAAAADSWLPAAEATLAAALAETQGAEGERLRALQAPVRSAIGALAAIGTTPALRIHGDLHVGQVLRWDGGDALTDFDGNPLAPVKERTAPGPAARDVASMVRAIDHAIRICERRRPGRDDDLRAWFREARTAFLDGYRSALGAEHVRLFDERLLGPLEVAQECHEYLYAARYIPRWRYVPDLALPDLLETLP